MHRLLVYIVDVILIISLSILWRENMTIYSRFDQFLILSESNMFALDSLVGLPASQGDYRELNGVIKRATRRRDFSDLYGSIQVSRFQTDLMYC